MGFHKEGGGRGREIMRGGGFINHSNQYCMSPLWCDTHLLCGLVMAFILMGLQESEPRMNMSIKYPVVDFLTRCIICHFSVTTKQRFLPTAVPFFLSASVGGCYDSAVT